MHVVHELIKVCMHVGPRLKSNQSQRPDKLNNQDVCGVAFEAGHACPSEVAVPVPSYVGTSNSFKHISATM